MLRIERGTFEKLKKIEFNWIFFYGHKTLMWKHNSLILNSNVRNERFMLPYLEWQIGGVISTKGHQEQNRSPLASNQTRINSKCIISFSKLSETEINYWLNRWTKKIFFFFKLWKIKKKRVIYLLLRFAGILGFSSNKFNSVKSNRFNWLPETHFTIALVRYDLR